MKRSRVSRFPTEPAPEAARNGSAPAPDGTGPPWKDALDLIEHLPSLPPELITGILHQGAKLVLGGASVVLRER